MDADSSYGGSDTAQDSHSGHDNNSSLETTHNAQHEEPNNFYHKNEITLPINYDETDFQDQNNTANTGVGGKQPHYLSTANLNINETLEHHSNLEEMSKNYKSTNYLNEPSPKTRKKSDAGVVNPAFQADDYKEVKSTFDHNKPYNGDLNSMGLASPNSKNDEPLTEAVNLELINLKPTGKDVTGPYENGNGTTSIPVKKESDAEMGNPYDEYFVPVNEHRKYMRGEKLYVTMDKRNKKKRNKCLCWGICLCLVAAAVIIGILAAVGVIGNQGAPVQEVSARNFGDAKHQPEVKAAGGIFGLPKDLASDATTTTTTPETPTRRFTPEPPVTTVSNMLPSTETSMIQVPRALESQLVIDNLQFTPALANKNSTEYKKLAEALETELKNSLFSSDVLNYGAADIEVKVMNFSSGSVVVKYRITWTFKDGVHHPKDPINEEMLKRKMRSLLDRNSGFMDTYHIVGNTVTAERVLDLCKIDNNGCEHQCSFDYKLADFTCTCPEGKRLANNKKNCIDIQIIEPEPVTDFHFDHVHIHEAPQAVPEPVQPEPTPEPTSEPSVDHHHVPAAEPTPEPSAEPTAEPQPSDHHDHDHYHVMVEPTAEPAAEPTAEPEPETKDNEHFHINHHIVLEPSAEPTTEPAPEPTNKPEEVSRENYVNLHEIHRVEYTTLPSHFEPTAEPKIKPTAEPAAEPTAEPKSEPTAEPTAEPKSEPAAEPTAEPKSEPAAEPTAEPKSEPAAEPTAEPKSEPAAEPTAEPKSEPAAEPTAEPKSEPAAEPTAEPKSEPDAEPTAEPKSEPAAEPTAEPKSNEPLVTIAPHVIVNTTPQPISEPTAEPAAEPTAEPVPEPTDQNKAEPTVKPKSNEQFVTVAPQITVNTTTAEPSAEPTAEPAAEPTVQPKPELASNLTAESKSEPIAEPSAEPTSTPESIAIQTIAPTTQSSSHSEVILRQNNLHEEIFAEPEATTMLTKEEKPLSSTNEITTTRSELAGATMISIVSEEKSEQMTTMQPSISPAVVTEAATEKTSPLIVNDLLLTGLDNESNDLKTESNIIPVVINNQSKLLHSESAEITNASETTTQPSDMAKIFTEMHKVIDQSTEMISPQAMNQTHLNVAVVDSTENTSGLDNMSPFLPEIENDTFVNKLHRGEHLPHIQNETHEEEASETQKPPRLDNDEKNVTNPQDPNPKDTSLKVIPLEGADNEIPDKIIVSTVPSKIEEITRRIPSLIPVVAEHEAVVTTMETVTEAIKHEDVTHNYVTVSTEAKPASSGAAATTTTLKSVEEIKTTLPPEIINNVHSNSYFDNLGLVQQESEENKTQEVSTSTEDLIALETTTNMLKHDNKNITAEITTEDAKSNETITTIQTIYAEVIDTVTESVSFSSKSNDSIIVTTAKNVDDAKVTTIMPPVTTINQYEVKETVADVTTTEKLFVASKATTESPLIPKTDYEDLSVIPLKPQNDLKKNDARVANEENLNNLESDNSDNDNDISEERLVLDKFNHNFNEIKTSDSTTTKNDEADSTEYSKYDDSKSNKKTYQDKYKFDKKVKLEKVITTLSHDDEIMTTSLPSDKQSSPFSDVKPVTENFDLPPFSRCAIGQFQCANGTSIKDGSYCIAGNDRCDNVDDCSDASDEINCEKDGCPNNFQCASGQCLKRHLVCDGIQNCNDGSDEIACDQWSCRFDEVSCGPGHRCLPLSWKCDGRMQCPDGSDEHNCPASMCTESSFKCLEQDTCIPNGWKCDGKSDCVNSEDERSCQCGSDEFKCALGGGCVKSDQRCDGVDNCADRSDEWNCFDNKKYLQIEIANNTFYPVCADNWNATHSDQVCRYLGYSGAASTENLKKPDGEFTKYVKLKSQQVYGAPILSQFEKDSSCDSFVTLTCQEFACGSHSATDVQSARIIGGNRAAETQWPSLTLLYNQKKNWQCTSTVVAPSWVIASHSCVIHQSAVESKEWILYAGSTNFFNNADNSTTQVRQIKKIIAHPQAKYSQFEFTNDVVLIELEKPLTLTRNVSAACLPEKDIEPRQLCVIAGWGVSKPGEPNKNQYLHYLPVPVIDSEECNSTKHYNGLMSQGKICAGYTDSEKTPCYNDEGAPLMCFSDSAGTWELQGVLSHHDNCARSKHPAIYTTISSKIREWVANTIGQKPSRSA